MKPQSIINLFLSFVLFGSPISCLSGIKLFYYSSQASVPVELQDIPIEEAHVDPFKQLKVIVHGIVATSLVEWYDPLIQAYLGKGDQVLAIDWGEYAFDGYDKAVEISDDIGAVIAEYTALMRETFGLSFDKVHIMGHSIGAHIAGFAGKHAFATTEIKIGRITGLDPCKPTYETVPASERLDVNDADFVDVIHTNAGIGGLKNAIGHADFYPDGGSIQNSCSEFGCSHSKVTEYMIESVNSNNFVAKQCKSYLMYILQLCRNNPVAIMGEGCDSTASGVYYLSTNSYPPYGKGE